MSDRQVRFILTFGAVVLAFFIHVIAVQAAPAEPAPDLPIRMHFTVVEVQTTVRSTGLPLDGAHYVVRLNGVEVELVTDLETPVRQFVFHGNGMPVVFPAFGHGALPVSRGTVTASTSTDGRVTIYVFNFLVDFPD